MPVLAGALLEVAVVVFEVGFVEVEVTSVVDGFTEVVVDVATGRHWPMIISREKVYGFEETYCTNCSGMCTRSPIRTK